MRIKNLANSMAVLLWILASYFLLSVLLTLIGGGFSGVFGLLGSSGEFFFKNFLMAAFYIPAYLFICAALLIGKGFRKDILFIVTASLLPFVTLAAALHLLVESPPSALTAFFKDNFGSIGGMMVLAVLFVLELLLIYRLKLLWFSGTPGPPAGQQPSLVGKLYQFAREKGSALKGGNREPYQAVAADSQGAPDYTGESAVPPGEEPLQVGWETDHSLTPQEEWEQHSYSFSLPKFPKLEESHAAKKLKAPRGVSGDREKPPVSPASLGPFYPEAGGDPDVGSGSAAVEPPGSTTSGSARGAERELKTKERNRHNGERESALPDPLISDKAREGKEARETAVRAQESVEAEKPDDPAEPELYGELQAVDDSPDDMLFNPQGSEQESESADSELPAWEEEEEKAWGGLGAGAENPDKPATDPGEKKLPSARLEAADKPRAGSTEKQAGHNPEYKVPVTGLLNEYSDYQYWEIDASTQGAALVLKETLAEFRIEAEVTGIRKGPVITMFEILPAPGVKLSKIVNLADNIALRLAASRVRIVAPIPGKHAVGIEVPNKKRSLVSFREMIDDEAVTDASMEIPIILGKDISGESQIIDLTHTPHLLIAGATGSGKSVCVNSIIASILYSRTPEQVKLLLIDPKIVELKLYNDIPHLLTPVITEPKRAFKALQYCLYEMERRYSLLDALGVRDVKSYNKKIKDRRLATTPLPYIVIVVDEFADFMATTGKELESTLARLAAMARAVGIHLVLATQRPSIDVITGLIKANIPSRIAFMVAGKFDSRIIIDTVGAEKLLGKGDMLFTSAWNPFPVRLQGAFLAEEEVERIADYVKELGEPEYIDEEIFLEDDEDVMGDISENGTDLLLDKAIEIVVTAGKASASYLQRRLQIGYNRAARLVEDMERRGIVGAQNGSKPREIIHVPDNYKE